MTKKIIIDGVNVVGCEHLYGGNNCDDIKLSSIYCAKNNCRYKEYKHLQRENKEKIDIIEQMIKILYPNASDDELYDVTFNGEYIDKLKELKDTADTMLMANDIKKQDIDSLREANERLEQKNKELKEAYDEISNNSEILHENHSLRIANAKLSEDLWQHGISMREWREQSLKYRSALEEILESAKFAQCLPCGSGNLEDCLNCNDDTTNNGQFCMEKRIHEIKTKCVEVLNDKKFND